jgi:transcriptional regulator GlxA family with amidase domain
MQTHRVAVLGYEGMAPFELGVIAEVFALPRPELEVDWWYSFVLCAEQPGRLSAVGGFAIEAPAGLEGLRRADTIFLPGTADVHSDPPDRVIRALQSAHRRGARLVSICSGAFVLAAAGLLDGGTAATHWRYADILARRFPNVSVDDRVLYIDSGRVLTSAGTAAGIDVCLHIVRKDHGARIANQVARRMVVAPHRDGGQAQFIEAPVAENTLDDPVGAALSYASERIGERHSLASLAQTAHLSPRQFSRRFQAATGTSPMQWLIAQRVQTSLQLLEGDEIDVESVGRTVGFATPAAYRRHFRRRIGMSPAAYRAQFRRDKRFESAIA